MIRPAPCCRWTRVQRPLRCLLREAPPLLPPRRGGASRSWLLPADVPAMTLGRAEKLWHFPTQIPKQCDGASRVVEAFPSSGSGPPGGLFPARRGASGSAALARPLRRCGRCRGVPPLLGGGSIPGGRFGELG